MGKESKTVTVPEREQQHLQATHETTRGTPVGANLPFKAMARLQRVAGNQAIGSLLGGGQPLPDGIRGEMQQRFGVDFSQVRVLTMHKPMLPQVGSRRRLSPMVMMSCLAQDTTCRKP